MNTASNASFVFLIVSMLACSFAIYRKRTRSRKMGGDAYPILPTSIIFLNMIISVVIAFVHLMWVNSSPLTVHYCRLPRYGQCHRFNTRPTAPESAAGRHKVHGSEN